MSKQRLAVTWTPAVLRAARLGGVALALLAGLALVPLQALRAQDEPPPSPGRTVYKANCEQCHGAEGDGQGPAFDAVYPRPRNFTYGLFKFRRTSSGELPTPEDLVQMISNGMPGTSMPAWGKVLTQQQIRDVAKFLPRFYGAEEEPPPEARDIGTPPEATPERIARGRELFEKLECPRCHGPQGRGNGYTSMRLVEDWNQEPIFPRNLTAGWQFRGGHRPEDIYRTVVFGVNGTPMPAYIDEEAFAEEADRWALVHYVRSLSTDTEPPVRSTFVARRVEGEIPSDPAAEAWSQAERYYVPLAGQVIQEPRLFQPSVTYLWVQLLYSADEIGLRIEWVDPTTADNDAYKEALRTYQEEGPPPESDSRSAPRFQFGPPAPVDELVVQFPARFAPEDPLPYFLMGQPGKPLRLWVWRSDAQGIRTASASGLGNWKYGEGDGGLQSSVEYRDGLYSLVIRRKRLTEGSGGPQFASEPGLMPISFSVADGFMGEGGYKRAVSTWYTVLLQRPVETKVYYLPVVLALVIGGLEWKLLQATRRRAGSQSSDPSDGSAS